MGAAREIFCRKLVIRRFHLVEGPIDDCGSTRSRPVVWLPQHDLQFSLALFDMEMIARFPRTSETRRACLLYSTVQILCNLTSANTATFFSFSPYQHLRTRFFGGKCCSAGEWKRLVRRISRRSEGRRDILEIGRPADKRSGSCKTPGQSRTRGQRSPSLLSRGSW